MWTTELWETEFLWALLNGAEIGFMKDVFHVYEDKKMYIIMLKYHNPLEY